METLSIIQFKGWQNTSVVMVPPPPPSYSQRPCKQHSRNARTHVEQTSLTLKICDVQNSLPHLANHFVSLCLTRFFFFGSGLLHWSESQSWCTGLELSLSQTVDASVILSRGWDTQGKCSYWLTAVWSSGRRSI